jgi:hypothetical protein
MAKKMDQTPKSNLTPETYLEHRAAVGATYTALQTAQSEHQTAMKRAKNAGIDTKALAQVMKLGRQDPEEVAMHFRNLARFAAWEGLPIGAQGSLFGTTDDQHPTEKAQAEYSLHRAEDDGHHEGAAGALRESNPHPTASEAWQRWDKGWLAGQATIAAEMAPKKAKGRRKASGNPEDRASA